MSKRSAEHMPAAPVPPGLLINVMTVMKAAYGIVPKAFWGLSHAGEACIAGGTSREFTIDTLDSFKHYCRHLTEPGAYRIVRLRTAAGFNRRITILDTVGKVTLGSSRPKLPRSSLNLEEIEFDEECAFNRQIAIPSGVRKARFGRWFNRSISLPSSLHVVEFGENYNRPLSLPHGLLELYLGDRFNQFLVLPDGIRGLRLGRDFRQNIQYPASLRDIAFAHHTSYYVALRPGLQRITLRGSYWNNNVLPATVKYANIGRDVSVDSWDLPLGLEELVWHRNVHIDVPVSVKHLTLGEAFQQPLELKEGLESIVFLGSYSGHKLDLPRGLKSITMKNSRKVVSLPDGCVRLY